MTRYYHCGECDTVVDAKYAKNHPKGKLSYLFATDDKEKKIDDIAEDEDKEKEEELTALKAELRGKSHEELDKMKEDLKAQIEELRKKMDDEEDNKSKEAKRKKYSVLGYDNAAFNYNAVAGDWILKDLGSTN